MITREAVLDALRNVEDPDFKKDLVTLNMIRDIEVTPKRVAFSVVLTTPACPMKGHIEYACRNAIAFFVDKDVQVDINMTHEVKNRPDTEQLAQIKNIVLVSAGKGGVGKSTVAANIALALAKKGAKVGLLDADIYGPSIPIMFGLEGARPHATQSPDGKTSIEPINKFGIKVLSMGFFTDPKQPIPWRGPMASAAIKQLFGDADWGELDYLIVDLPPGTGDIHITVAQNYPIAGAVIVTTPQQVAIADVTKGIGMFMMENINIPVLGIVENMAYFIPKELPDNKYYIFGKGGGKRLAQELNLPFLGELPLVKDISDAGDNGYPLVAYDDSETAQAFFSITEKIAQQLALQHTGL